MSNRQAMVSGEHRFHLALPVDDLAAARSFYGKVLGCPSLSRSNTDQSAGFDFFGHELVLHEVSERDAIVHRLASQGANAAIRHFGVYLPASEWERVVGAIADYDGNVLGPVERSGDAFVLVADPSENVIEFKTVERD